MDDLDDARLDLARATERMLRAIETDPDTHGTIIDLVVVGRIATPETLEDDCLRGFVTGFGNGFEFLDLSDADELLKYGRDTLRRL